MSRINLASGAKPSETVPGLRRSTGKHARCAFCGLRTPRGAAGGAGLVPLFRDSRHYFVCPDCAVKRRTGPGLDALGRVSHVQIQANRRPMGWRDKHPDFTKHAR